MPDGGNLAAARTWLEKAAAQGYTQAYFPCGKLYFESEPDPQLGKLTEHDLAKAYLWLTGAAKGSTDEEEIKQALALVDEIKRIMPQTWQSDLDAQVATHLKSFPPVRD